MKIVPLTAHIEDDHNSRMPVPMVMAITSSGDQ
jgi:hypothetical protein